MNLFFDTEFTGLQLPTSLISLGIVAANGEQFYAEFTDYHTWQVDKWIHKHVISQLQLRDLEEHEEGLVNCSIKQLFQTKGNAEFITKLLQHWLTQFHTVQLIGDVANYDFLLFCNLFGGSLSIPANVSPVCHDINQDIALYLGVTDKEAFEVNRREFLHKPNPKEHHALADAWETKRCHNKIQSYLFPKPNLL